MYENSLYYKKLEGEMFSFYKLPSMYDNCHEIIDILN